MIEHIRQTDDLFKMGRLYVPMFDKKIEVWIENTVDMDYAQQCAEHLTCLGDDLIDKICERAISYYKFMVEEWQEFEEVSGGILEEINAVMSGTIEGRDILHYITAPKLYVFPPEADGIAYSIECECVWEPEHGLEIILRDDRLLYVGPAECLGAWESDDVYEVDY